MCSEKETDVGDSYHSGLFMTFLWLLLCFIFFFCQINDPGVLWAVDCAALIRRYHSYKSSLPNVQLSLHSVIVKVLFLQSKLAQVRCSGQVIFSFFPLIWLCIYETLTNDENRKRQNDTEATYDSKHHIVSFCCPYESYSKSVYNAGIWCRNSRRSTKSKVFQLFSDI